MTLRRNSRENLQASQGGLSGSSLLREDGSLDGHTGRLDQVRGVQKTLKSKLSLKGNYQAGVHSGQW
jgi:hypothetical protein